MSTERTPPERDHRLDLHWLLRLRWVAVTLQIGSTLSAKPVFDMDIPVGELLGVAFFGAISNVLASVYSGRASRVREQVVTFLLALDVGLLTILLELSGGPENPFCFLYFVHVALASMLLGTRGTWFISALTLVSFGSLFFLPRRPWERLAFFERQEAKWMAFAVATVVVTYFVERVRRALAERETEIARIRAEQQRDEKLAALATLAAGAAHELATPLGTIAIAAKEIERAFSTDPRLSEDARLIREEVARCRVILDQMSAKAGESSGEIEEVMRVRDVLHLALESVPDRALVKVDVDATAALIELRLPVRAFCQAMRVLATNARDASKPGAEVHVRARAAGPMVVVEVVDTGEGMSPEVLRRAGEPFFTTKEPGRGTGLGLFLTRSVVERLGGRLELESTLGQGSTVRMSIPLSR